MSESSQAPITLEERIAKLEGRMASSWACQTRDEYETRLKDGVKQELISYVTKIVISGVIALGGAGYLYMKSAVTDVYQTENKKSIADLKARYETNLMDEQRRFEWERNHDYAKNYIYLAEFYFNSALESNKKNRLVKKALDRANTYFEYAMRADTDQASTYFELGELNYTYPKKFNINSNVDISKAYTFYERSINLYTEAEVSEGWRADSLRMMGILRLTQASKVKEEEKKREMLNSAVNFLRKAQEEYAVAIPESASYNHQRMKETIDNLVLAEKQLHQ